MENKCPVTFALGKAIEEFVRNGRKLPTHQVDFKFYAPCDGVISSEIIIDGIAGPFMKIRDSRPIFGDLKDWADQVLKYNSSYNRCPHFLEVDSNTEICTVAAFGDMWECESWMTDHQQVKRTSMLFVHFNHEREARYFVKCDIEKTVSNLIGSIVDASFSYAKCLNNRKKWDIKHAVDDELEHSVTEDEWIREKLGLEH